MVINSSFRFRTKKQVGSPSAVSQGFHTMASHLGEPNAHPQYLRKGEEFPLLDIKRHIAQELDHARGYARRMELMDGKRDWIANRNLSLLNDANNYGALLEPRRHIVTAYVLNQILEDYGFTDSVNFANYLAKGNLVTTVSVRPTSDMDKFIPSFALFKKLQDQVSSIKEQVVNLLNHTHHVSDFDDGTDNVFATIAGVNNKFDSFLEALESDYAQIKNDLVIEFNNLKDNLAAAYAAKMGMCLTSDAQYQASTKYYAFNDEDDTFTLLLEGTDYDVGDNIPATGLWIQPGLQETIKALYPVGSIYITMNGDTAPFAGSGTTWELIGKGKTLWGYNPSDTYPLDDPDHPGGIKHATGDELAEGLPDLPAIEAKWQFSSSGSGTNKSIHGGNDSTTVTTNEVVSVDYVGKDTTVYGKSTTVQPPALVVAFWKRTA